MMPTAFRTADAAGIGPAGRGGTMAGGSTSEKSPLDDPAGGRVPRRTVLKGLGAGAVGVWSKPLITSVRASGPQGYPQPCEPGECGCFCPDAPVCGTDSNGTCFCGRTTGSTCFCGS